MLSSGAEKGKGNLSALEAGHLVLPQPRPWSSENTDLSHVEACSWFPTPRSGTAVAPTLVDTSAGRFSLLMREHLISNKSEDSCFKGWKGNEMPIGIFLFSSSLPSSLLLTVPIGSLYFSQQVSHYPHSRLRKRRSTTLSSELELIYPSPLPGANEMLTACVGQAVPVSCTHTS